MTARSVARTNRAAPSRVEDDLSDAELAEFDEFDAAADASGDKLQLDPRVHADAKARGVIVQWKRYSIYGKPDTEYYGFLMRRKFVPVAAGVYKKYGVCLPDHPDDEPVIREGQILMERPLKWHNHAIAMEKMAANEQVADKERQLFESPEGTMKRTVRNISRTHAPVAGVAIGGLEIE